MRDIALLNETMVAIGDAHGGLDGLIAAAGIQQETSALEYTAEDANKMLEVNITGCFMAAQATAKQMIRFGKGGSIVMIASMSGHVANRVRPLPCSSILILIGHPRVSSARFTTPPKQVSYSWAGTWPVSGANIRSVSIPFRPATSSRTWLKHYS